MRTSTIVSIAAICGITATVWSLVAQSRHADISEAGMRRGGGGGGGRPAQVALPTDRAGLEDFVAKSPDNDWGWHQLAVVRMKEDDEEGARAAWEETARAAQAAAGSPRVRPRTYFSLAWANYKLGRATEARILAYKAEQLHTDPEFLARAGARPEVQQRLGWLREIQGKHEGAVEAWREAARLIEEQIRAVPPDQLAPGLSYDLACNRALAGDTGGAFDALTHAVRAGFSDAAHALHDEDLASIRDEPQFRDLISRMPRPTRLIGP